MEEKLITLMSVWNDDRYTEHLEEFLTDGWGIKEFKVEGTANSETVYTSASRRTRNFLVVVHLVRPVEIKT